MVEDKDGNIKWEESPKWLEAGHEWVHDYYSIEGESIHEFVEYWYKDDKGNMKQAGHKVFEMPIIEVATNKVTTIENFKANLDKNFEYLNNKILEYKNKCPNSFCYDGEETATIVNVIKNRSDLMRKFNENLFREKRGMNRRISHDAEIKK